MPVLTPLRQLAILSLLALVVGVPACARAPDVAVPREPEIRSADEAEAAFWRAQQELAAAMGREAGGIYGSDVDGERGEQPPPPPPRPSPSPNEPEHARSPSAVPGTVAPPASPTVLRAEPAAAPDEDSDRAAPSSRADASVQLHRCRIACGALASMQRAAHRLCELAGDDDARCTMARYRLAFARVFVYRRCPVCAYE